VVIKFVILEGPGQPSAVQRLNRAVGFEPALWDARERGNLLCTFPDIPPRDVVRLSLSLPAPGRDFHSQADFGRGQRDSNRGQNRPRGWKCAMRQVLVIDDDILVCETITETLREWPGTNVTCVQHAIEGAQKLRERHFDLALIDGMLPDLSGIQLAEVAANENTPVLLLSGHPDVNQTAAAFGFPYLPKPFSTMELLLSSRDAFAQAHENVARIKASAARLQASIEAARATIAASAKGIDGLKFRTRL
jgi:CheY-like chemotaxis protein